MKVRLNNKGNTLSIVLIGIFILSILGTLILGITSTNYQMKVINAKSEMGFYYAEKASDEVYAYIGGEIMNCINQSYTRTIERVVRNTGTNYTSRSESELKDVYIKYLEEGKDPLDAEVLDGLKKLYPEDPDKVEDIGTRFMTNVPFLDTEAPSGYTFKVFQNTDGNVRYEIDGDGHIEAINLENVCVECTSKEGNYVNVTLDYRIELPDFKMNFTDTVSALNLDEFYKFAIIAQGNKNPSVSDVKPALVINSNKKLNLTGNVYTDGETQSVLVKDGAGLVSKSKLFICEKRFEVQAAEVTMSGNVINSIDSTLGVEGADTLQFYANNISTEQGSLTTTATGTTKPKVTIKGNCIVEDDLEINAPNTEMKIEGDYFGSGYRRNDDGSEKVTLEDITGFTANNTAKEHLESSAIIINETNASLDFSGLKRLILGGRAYIDLNEIRGVGESNASYMTGESVSFKTNQIAYLASNEALAGSKVEGKKYVSLTEFNSLRGFGEDKEDSTDPVTNTTYESLGLNGLNQPKVIAKLQGGNVYFYDKPLAPKDQTTKFVNYFNNSANREALNNKLATLNVQKVDFPDTFELFYAVGAVTEVNNYKYTGRIEHLGNFRAFDKVINDINKRRKNLIPAFKDDSNKYPIGKNETDIDLGDSTSLSMEPFVYYLSEEFVNKSKDYNKKHIYNFATESEIVEKLIKATESDPGKQDTLRDDISAGRIKVGYIVDNKNSGLLTLGEEFQMGIVVTTRPVELKGNFTGIIITNESIEIAPVLDEEIKVKAAPDMVKTMIVEELDDIINDRFNLTDTSDKDVVTSESLNYQDLITKSNWRKNK